MAGQVCRFVQVRSSTTVELTRRHPYHPAIRRPDPVVPRRQTGRPPARRVSAEHFTPERASLGARTSGVGWRGRIRTFNFLIQSQVPYRLATRQRRRDDTSRPLPGHVRGRSTLGPSLIRGAPEPSLPRDGQTVLRMVRRLWEPSVRRMTRWVLGSSLRRARSAGGRIRHRVPDSWAALHAEPQRDLRPAIGRRMALSAVDLLRASSAPLSEPGPVARIRWHAQCHRVAATSPTEGGEASRAPIAQAPQRVRTTRCPSRPPRPVGDADPSGRDRGLGRLARRPGVDARDERREGRGRRRPRCAPQRDIQVGGARGRRRGEAAHVERRRAVHAAGHVGEGQGRRPATPRSSCTSGTDGAVPRRMGRTTARR